MYRKIKLYNFLCYTIKFQNCLYVSRYYDKSVILILAETYRCCGAETSFDLGYMAWEDNNILKPSKAWLYLRKKTAV